MCWFKKRPIKDMDTEDAIWWLDYDIELHKAWLSRPEGPNTGTYAYHRQWIMDFQEAIKWLKGERSALSFREVIEKLRLAQSTHIEDAKLYPVNTHEYKWNYDWFYVYESIIILLRETPV